MADLKNPRWIIAKGLLFLVCGVMSVTLILMEHLEIRLVILLTLAVWCFCRFYYFAFYVIEHYVDPQFRFAGLFDFARYLWNRRRSQGET